MALSLDEFYCDLEYAVVSSLTRKGMEDVVGKFEVMREEFVKIRGTDKT
jgi:hypothetical protein